MFKAKRIESREEECRAFLTNLNQARECDRTYTSLHLIVFVSMYDRAVKHKRNSPRWSVWLSLATPFGSSLFDKKHSLFPRLFFFHSFARWFFLDHFLEVVSLLFGILRNASS